MRLNFLSWPIRQTVSGEYLKLPSPSRAAAPAVDTPLADGIGRSHSSRPPRLEELAQTFALLWSAYVCLLLVKDGIAPSDAVKDPYVLEFLDL